MIQVAALKKLIKNLKCSHCKTRQSLQLKFSCVRGFSKKMTIFCENCEEEESSEYTSPKLSSGGIDVNKRMAEAFVAMGVNHSGVQKLETAVNMHIPARKNFNRYSKLPSSESKQHKEKVLSWSRKAAREAHIEVNPALEDCEVIDIPVSFVGTWHKRGHTSNHGIGFVIDLLTGLVVDYEILSKFCLACSRAQEKLKGAEFEEWERKHKETDTCEINYSGTSGAMEQKAAEIIWLRSVGECKFRYNPMLADGDASVHLLLQRLKPYGEDFEIEKEDCINHVGKRVYTGLKKTVTKWKNRKGTLGGKSPGNLTEEKMKKLQNYYTSAIRKNAPNIQQMKSAILATPHHCMSTDEKPYHDYCPGGEESWCFYNRAISKGEQPRSHKENIKTALRPEVVEKIMPVYERLSKEELLQRCTRQGTQNANECLHSCIWLRAPKHKGTSKNKLKIAVSDAVAHFNMGYHASFALKHSNIQPEQEKNLKESDRERVARSKARATEGSRKARKERKKPAIAQREKERRKEGTTYEAGKF